MVNEIPSLTIQEFNTLKSGFIKQGLSFTGWCKDNGLNPVNAKSAILGSWNGPKAKDLRAKAIHASGVYKEIFNDELESM